MYTHECSSLYVKEINEITANISVLYKLNSYFQCSNSLHSLQYINKPISAHYITMCYPEKSNASFGVCVQETMMKM